MNLLPLAAAVCALALVASARANDLKALEGTWKVKAGEARGKAIDSEELKAVIVTIKGDRYEVTTNEGKDGGTLKLDETQKPKTIDATDTEGLDAGKVVKAIYELSGDTLRVCYAIEGEERPTRFATSEDSPFLLITYEREKPAKAEQ